MPEVRTFRGDVSNECKIFLYTSNKRSNPFLWKCKSGRLGRKLLPKKTASKMKPLIEVIGERMCGFDVAELEIEIFAHEREMEQVEVRKIWNDIRWSTGIREGTTKRTLELPPIFFDDGPNLTSSRNKHKIPQYLFKIRLQLQV